MIEVIGGRVEDAADDDWINFFYPQRKEAQKGKSAFSPSPSQHVPSHTIVPTQSSPLPKHVLPLTSSSQHVHRTSGHKTAPIEAMEPLIEVTEGSEYGEDLLDLEFQRMRFEIDDSEFNLESERERKLFVGGLSWTTTEDGLQHYFESLSFPVEKVTIMRDKLTGRSRGFGFVTLRDPQHVDKALLAYLYLDGRRIEAKRAIPKQDMDNPAKKIFVGGIPITLSNTEFRKYFESFGTVLETQVMTDRDTGRSRGFGFVTFEDENVTIEVLRRRHEILGKPVEVKRAEPKKADFQQSIHLMHPMNLQSVYLSNHYAYPTTVVYSSQPKIIRRSYDNMPYYVSGPGRMNTFRSDLDQKVDWGLSGRPNSLDAMSKDREDYEHIRNRMKINEVRSERALSDGILPELNETDYFDISEQIRKKRGMSSPATTNTTKPPTSLIIGSSRLDNVSWREDEKTNSDEDSESFFPSNNSPFIHHNNMFSQRSAKVLSTLGNGNSKVFSNSEDNYYKVTQNSHTNITPQKKTYNLF